MHRLTCQFHLYMFCTSGSICRQIFNIFQNRQNFNHLKVQTYQGYIYYDIIYYMSVIWWWYIYNILYTTYIYIYYDMLLWNGATHPAWSVNLRYDRMPVVKSEEHWARAFHGTWWYSVWLVLESGVFLESNDRDKGRDDQGPGLAGYQWHGQQISRKSGSPTFRWMRSPICCCINPPYFCVRQVDS